MELRAVDPVLGPLAFFFFMLVNFYFLMNVFISIVTDAYHAVKSEIDRAERAELLSPNLISGQRDFIDFLESKIRHLLRREKSDNNFSMAYEAEFYEWPNGIPTSLLSTLK